MATLRDFFTTEATDFLNQLSQSVQKLDTGNADLPNLQRHARALRGSAQMAREDRVFRAASGLESAVRALNAKRLAWNQDVSSRFRLSLEDIQALVRGTETDEQADERVRRTLDRWRELGLDLPGEPASAAAPVSEASKQFRQFAAHEVAGVIGEIEIGLEMLDAEPRNRDPLKAILRRQRALLGSARLEEIGIVAEALRAIEDLTRVIAKLNVPVKEEWLSVFRSARDVLKAALEPLQRGEAPSATPALSKLRTLRQELLDRYGEGQAVNVATPVAPAVVAAPTAPVIAGDEPVSMDQLSYRGERALRRALEMQDELRRLVAHDPVARERLDELFDLIRLGIA